MKEIWNEIEGFLAKHVPTVLPTLNEPVTEEELILLESEIGTSISVDLKNYLRIHNGQNDPSRLETLCEEGTLLSTGAIIETYRMLNEINESGDISDGWWARKYLPITDCEGDHLAIDLETGDMVMHVHDSEIEVGIAGSFKEWFESKLAVFTQGKFSVDEGYLDYWEYGS